MKHTTRIVAIVVDKILQQQLQAGKRVAGQYNFKKQVHVLMLLS